MSSNNEKDYQEEKFAKNLTIKEKGEVFKKIFLRAVTLLIHPLKLWHSILLVIYAFFPNCRLVKHNLLYGDDMIKLLLSTNKSLIRWGDGETFLAYGQDIAFQKFDQSLGDYLHQILDEYDISSSYFLAIPLTPILMSPFKLFMSGYFVFWHKTRVLFKKKRFPLGTHLMDAFLFRPLSASSSDSIEKLWINKKVILVTSSQEYVDVFKEKNSRLLLGSVIIPSENAYSELAFIKKSITSYCIDIDLNQIRILISAGPTAKVLVYQLSIEGYICYDVGHYLKWKMNQLVPKGVL